MSFTVKVKEEVIGNKLSEPAKVSFISGFIRNNYQIIDNNIVFSNENFAVIDYLKQLFDSYDEIKYKELVLDNNNFSKNKLIGLEIIKGKEFLDETFCLFKEVIASYLVSSDDEVKGYLKGAFVSSGSINDPKTSRYHLEFFVDRPQEAVFIQKLLNKYMLNAKLLDRDRGFMLYVKEADKISDFLKILGCNKAVLYYEDVRVYRDKKNKINRINNCEQANMDKVIKTAFMQLDNIEVLEKNDATVLLDDKLMEALKYRKKYPEVSLKELSEIISLETGKKITKSGLNHRFRKIKELASHFEKKD